MNDPADLFRTLASRFGEFVTYGYGVLLADSKTISQQSNYHGSIHYDHQFLFLFILFAAIDH